LHPISAEKWNKTDSIHSYRSEEFVRRILNVHDKKVPIYNLLRRFREGTNIKRNEDNEIPVEKLVSLPRDDLAKKMRLYYDQLKNALPPPTKIFLPHSTNNKKQRMNVLKARVASLYNVDHDKEVVYKSLDGYCNDGIIQYPFFVEIFAIPFKHPDRESTVFVGAVNYSISPKENGNLFEEEYSWYDERGRYREAEDILGVLREHRFYLMHEKGKIPCVIIANLITPRREPHGQDKSRIYTGPFTTAIIEAVSKLAPAIQTYHAAGWRFKDEFDRSTAKKTT
jgi:hypothetical protein